MSRLIGLKQTTCGALPQQLNGNWRAINWENNAIWEQGQRGSLVAQAMAGPIFETIQDFLSSHMLIQAEKYVCLSAAS